MIPHLNFTWLVPISRQPSSVHQGQFSHWRSWLERRQIPDRIIFCHHWGSRLWSQYFHHQHQNFYDSWLDFNNGQFLIAMPCRCFFITAIRCWCFLDILTITIGAIIFAQPLGPIILQWFFQFQTRSFWMMVCGKPKQRILRHAQICEKLCVYQCSGGKKGKIHCNWTTTLE